MSFVPCWFEEQNNHPTSSSSLPTTLATEIWVVTGRRRSRRRTSIVWRRKVGVLRMRFGILSLHAVALRVDHGRVSAGPSGRFWMHSKNRGSTKRRSSFSPRTMVRPVATMASRDRRPSSCVRETPPTGSGQEQSPGRFRLEAKSTYEVASDTSRIRSNGSRLQ